MGRRHAGRQLTATPIDSKTKERYAELIGLGLSHAEAAGATGISERSGERLMGQPAYRKIAEDGRRGRSAVQADIARVIEDLMHATRDDGTPNLLFQQKGAELALKYPDAVALLDANESDIFPEGSFISVPAGPGVYLPNRDQIVARIGRNAAAASDFGFGLYRGRTSYPNGA